MWASKHAPFTLSEFAGNADAVSLVRTWALDWARGKKGKPLLFFGPPGSGKTALAQALAKEMSWETVEMNASDLRNKEQIQRIAGSAGSAATLHGGLRLILIDEVDGLQAKDRGGAPAILELVKTSSQPVILTANDYWAPQLSSLRVACSQVEFKKINASSIATVLKRISEKEKISSAPEDITSLAKASQGDLRGAINDFQALSEGGALKQGSSSRDREKDVFDSLRKLLKASTFADAKHSTDGLDIDHDFFKKWVEENIPAEYETPGDIARAFDALSRSDVFDGRIMRRQSWRLFKYSNDLLTAGVALAKKEPYHKFTKYAFPKIIRMLSASKASRSMEKSIGLKIGSRFHCSARDAKAFFPLLRIEAEKGSGEAISEFFNLGEEESEFLFEGVKKEKKKAAEKKPKAKKEASA